MIIEWSHMALIAALLAALMQMTWAVLAYRYPDKRSLCCRIEWRLGWVVTALVTLAILGLFVAFYRCDFSVQYVAHHANTHLAWYYRLCALWGGHEGSLLLWLWLLVLWVAVQRYDRKPNQMWLSTTFGGVMAAVVSALLILMLTTSNPFLRYLPTAPIEGADLNPLLQDPGLISHPPILYMGYVGFSVVFGLALAGLLTHHPKQWVTHARTVSAWAWGFLTLGIVLGSAWAYRELGWGGVWFWDPVENASFMPWLVGTALLHTLVASDKRGHWHAWSQLLAMLAFILSLLGTFLVRSGVVISVHAFASDPSRGIGLLIILALLSLFALWVFARARTLQSDQQGLCARSAILLVQCVLAVISTLVVLIGTLFPMIVSATMGHAISVGPPYFNTVLLPLLVVSVLLMGVIERLPWGRPWQGWPAWPTVCTLLSGLWVGFYHQGQHALEMVLGVMMAMWLMLTTLQAFWRRGLPGSGAWAHMGLAICILGVLLGHYQVDERYISVQVGDHFEFAGHHWHWQAMQAQSGPNYHDQVASLSHHPLGQPEQIRIMHPTMRHYTTQTVDLAKVAIERHVWGDWYVALGPTKKSDVWTLRLHRRPFIYGVWLGGFMMVLGALSMVRRRR